MKRLALIDDADRHALTKPEHIISSGHSRTPILVPMSELLAVELVDDEADPLPEKSIRNLHIEGETGTP